MLRIPFPALALAAVLAASPAGAKTFRWANDGDVNAMDPATRQETVQLSFLSNIYEPLARRNRDLAARAGAGNVLGADIAHGLALPSAAGGSNGRMARPFTADDVVFTLKRILAPNSSMRAPMSPVKEARKIDDLTVDFETTVPDPIFLQEQTNLLIMSKAWCEAHNAAEPVTIGKEDNLRAAQRNGDRPVQAGLARARPEDGPRKEPVLVGQARGPRGPGGVRRHRLGADPGRRAAVR